VAMKLANTSKSNRPKRILIIILLLVVFAIIAGFTVWYFTKDNKSASVEHSGASTQVQPTDTNTTSSSDGATPTSPSDASTSASTTTTPGKSSSSSTSSSASSSDSSYNPHACDSYKATADNLKLVSDQKKTTYDTAFNQRKVYGDFYGVALQQYGNADAAKTIADQQYKQQQDNLTQLQSAWSSSLDDYNSAYGDYQSCMAKQ